MDSVLSIYHRALEMCSAPLGLRGVSDFLELADRFSTASTWWFFTARKAKLQHSIWSPSSSKPGWFPCSFPTIGISRTEDIIGFRKTPILLLWAWPPKTRFRSRLAL